MDQIIKFKFSDIKFSFSALAQHNIEPAQIDYVVCTHSHADHIGNNNLFTNAEHIVGRSVQRGTIFCEKNDILLGWFN
jgi:glyoxylase-like metal-dependent hydrolase (beta-lactamase superfamily II)